MKKIKDSIIVIGESITEYYYFNSLKDDYRQINIKPTYPKHSTGLDYLEQEIDKAVDAGYSREKEETGRDYTYSQMKDLFDTLGIKE